MGYDNTKETASPVEPTTMESQISELTYLNRDLEELSIRLYRLGERLEPNFEESKEDKCNKNIPVGITQQLNEQVSRTRLVMQAISTQVKKLEKHI